MPALWASLPCFAESHASRLSNLCFHWRLLRRPSGPPRNAWRREGSHGSALFHYRDWTSNRSPTISNLDLAFGGLSTKRRSFSFLPIAECRLRIKAAATGLIRRAVERHDRRVAAPGWFYCCRAGRSAGGSAEELQIPQVLRDLQLVDVLELTGSTTASAAQIGLSQASVSRRCRALARKLGLQRLAAASMGKR